MQKLKPTELLAAVIHYTRETERQRVLKTHGAPDFNQAQFSSCVDILFELVERTLFTMSRNGNKFTHEDVAVIAWGRSLEYLRAGERGIGTNGDTCKKGSQTKGSKGTKDAQATATRTQTVRTALSRSNIRAA